MKKIKLALFNLGALLYLEVFSAFIFFKEINFLSFVSILFFIIPIALFNTFVMSLLRKKINFILGIIIYCLLAIWFSTHLVFNKIFGIFFQISVLSISDQAAAFGTDAFSFVLSNLHLVILTFLPLVIFILLRNHLDLEKGKSKFFAICGSLIVTFLLFFYLFSGIIMKNTDYYKTIYKINNTSQSIKNLGIINASILDIYKTLTNFEEDISVTTPAIENEIDKPSETDYEENEDSNITEKIREIIYPDNVENINISKGNNSTINKYITNDIPTKQNEYSGIFKGKNLIYIVAESFHSIGVSKELTPTLYSLINDGYTFNNYYVPNNLSTIGGEFGALTGLFADNSILKKWRSGSNYFPYGIATKFKKEGYNTYAYHNNSYAFQDRYKYLKSQGFTNFKACYNGLEKLINCKRWPQSDIEMINKTVGDYVNKDTPFMTYYVTVSGHFQYTFSDNSIATKNKSLVKHLKYSEKVRGYLATQIELDRALELLINKLRAANKLDDTIIVLTADHYPYGLSEKEIAEVSTYKRDSDIELHHNNLIIWNQNLEKKDINKACMSIDVIPTIYNLFGIKYDSRLLIGKDIFSTSEGIAFVKNRSWVTDKGTYYSSKNKFVPKTNDIEDGYVDKINKIVSNRVNISRMIVANNYYKSVFK